MKGKGIKEIKREKTRWNETGGRKEEIIMWLQVCCNKEILLFNFIIIIIRLWFNVGAYFKRWKYYNNKLIIESFHYK